MSSFFKIEMLKCWEVQMLKQLSKFQHFNVETRCFNIEMLKCWNPEFNVQHFNISTCQCWNSSTFQHFNVETLQHFKISMLKSLNISIFQDSPYFGQSTLGFSVSTCEIFKSWKVEMLKCWSRFECWNWIRMLKVACSPHSSPATPTALKRQMSGRRRIRWLLAPKGGGGK